MAKIINRTARQELESLWAGLRHLENILGLAKTYGERERINRKIEIRKAEIKKFQLGWKLGRQDWKDQKILE